MQYFPYYDHVFVGLLELFIVRQFPLMTVSTTKRMQIRLHGILHWHIAVVVGSSIGGLLLAFLEQTWFT